MEEQSHYQKYKNTIYKNVLKAQKRKRDEKKRLYDQEVIKQYLKKQLEAN